MRGQGHPPGRSRTGLAALLTAMKALLEVHVPQALCLILLTSMSLFQDRRLSHLRPAMSVQQGHAVSLLRLTNNFRLHEPKLPERPCESFPARLVTTLTGIMQVASCSFLFPTCCFVFLTASLWYYSHSTAAAQGSAALPQTAVTM